MLSWDQSKRKKVIREHGIDFERIIDIFDDPFALFLNDFEHSTERETRYNIIGFTAEYGLVFLAYIYKKDSIRFITARRAENWMVRDYEKNRKRF